MTRRLLALVAALGITAAACGSDEGGLATYFESISDVTAGYGADLAGLPQASTDGTLDDARSFFSGVDAAIVEVLDMLGGISPPEEVTAAHQDLVDRVTEFAALAGQVAARGNGLETRADLLALANDPLLGVTNYGTAAADVVAACGELQKTADVGDIPVDLGCASLGRG